ncbi:glycosyltransferase family 4 protein [Mycolicibacterium grossiae]|nr:glycosyltransferase family 4 protein [Mycolicibacterium grossiae]
MQTHTGELTRALDARGVRQTVLTTWPPGSPRVLRLGRAAVVARLGLPVPVCRQFYAVPAARLVWQLARRHDLVHVHLGEDLAIVPLGLAAARRAGIPMVLTVHSSQRRTLRISGVRSAALKVVGSVVEDAGERRADRILVLTDRLRDQLAADGIDPERIRVVPSGVNPTLFDDASPIAPHGGQCLLFVGRLHPQKGVDTLIRAMADLPTAQLAIAGDGPDRAQLERLAERLGVADRIRFLGFVAHDDVPALMRRGDVFVMPSRYEELGTAIIEAMACGLPVVASRVGGIPNLVADGDTGLLTPPGDAPALAAALRRVLTEPGLAGKLGAEARARTAAYQWPALADRVLEAYREVVA